MVNTLEQRAEGSIVYRFSTPYDPKAQILYVNVIPKYKCSNNCTFCSKEDAIKGLPNIYEKKAGTSLYLSKAPTVEQVVNAVEKELQQKKTNEIAFVGLGEPLLQYSLVRDSIAAIREYGFKGKIRADTNGYVPCRTKIWFGCSELIDQELHPARELKRAGFDEAWISLNATNYKQYNLRCRPADENAWATVHDFIADCKREKLRIKLSFVIGGPYSPKPEDCLKYARSIGVKKKNVLLRDYVPPLSLSRGSVEGS